MTREEKAELMCKLVDEAAARLIESGKEITTDSLFFIIGYWCGTAQQSIKGGGQAMTQRTQHTPGPWRANGHTVLARVGTFHHTIVECRGQLFMADGEAEANARLIASAPELLTMLTRVLDEICMTEEGMKHVALLTLEQARNAIRKAKGGE